MQAEDDFNPVPGLCEWLDTDIRRVLAPNPSPMTFRGTNTYLLGRGAIAVIDPGPAEPTHIDAILAALEPGEQVSHILLTHSHKDHSMGVPMLKAATGAMIYAFGNSRAGLRAELAALTDLGGGEGVDADFAPDQCLADEAVINIGALPVRAIWTPGHMGNHMCFVSGDRIFTGDHVMGWATSMVSPPDGSVTDFMASLDRLGAQDARVFYPAHGAPVADPAGRIAHLRTHRQTREAQILLALQGTEATPAELAAHIYTDLAPNLLPAATRNVLAHLLDLTARNLTSCEGSPGLHSQFRLD